MMALKTPLCVAATLLTAAVVSAHLDGAPPGYSGAAGEGTCGTSGCHDTPPQGLGFIWDSGPPHLDTVHYSVELLVFPLVPQAWGFQLTVLDSLDQPFGEIVVTDTTRTKLITGPDGRRYLCQTAAGGLPSGCNNCTTWDFSWVRPQGAAVADPLYIYISAVGADGGGTPATDAVGTSVTVAPFCPVQLTGDIDQFGTISSSDIIYLVGYMFRGGPTPIPCAAVGDVNCDARITTADAIYLVNYVFKAGPPPCDVCPLIIDGAWDCY